MRPTIHQAASAGMNEFIEEAFREAQEGLDLDSPDESGMTPIYHAMFGGHISTVKLLLEKGAIPAKLNTHVPFLHAVCFTNYPEMVRAVLAYPAVLAELNSYMSSTPWLTPIMSAAVNSHLRLFQVLFEAGADLSMRTKNGSSMLVKGIIGQEDNPETFADKKEIIKLFLQRIDVNDRNNRKETPLMIIARDAYLSSMEVLLDSGADSTLQDREGMTALMKAAERGEVEAVKLLLRRGARPEQANNSGNTALHYATYNGHRAIVTTLLEAGAVVPLAESDENAIAIEGDMTALMKAAEQGETETVALLLRRGVNPKQANNSGDTALHYAAFNGHEAVVAALLEAGADPLAENTEGTIALCLAKQGKHTGVVQLLKEACAGWKHRLFRPRDNAATEVAPGAIAEGAGVSASRKSAY